MILLMNVDNENPSVAEGESVQIQGAGLTGFELKGNTHQDSYTGKNLFDGVFRQGGRYTTSLSDTNRLFTTQNCPIKSGVSYTISTTLNTSNFKYAINLATVEYPIENTTEGNAKQYYDSGWKTSSSFTFTPSQDGFLGIVVAKSNGSDDLSPSDIASVNWQLEQGSTATEYEPYTGGIPSPNPDYPQPIEVVTGDNTINIHGKNFWNENTQVFTNQSRFNNPTKDSNNVWNFTITGSNGYAFATSKITLQAGTYTASAIVDNGSFLLQKSGISINNTFTLTEETEITFRVYRNGNVGDVVKLSNVMIEQSPTATEYQPYQSVSYPISLGVENLFDYTKINDVSNGTNDNGVITQTGSNCIVYFQNGAIDVKNGEKLYFSCDIKLNSSSTGVFNNLNDGVNVTTTKISKPTLSTTYQRYITSINYTSDSTVNKILIQLVNLSGTAEIKNIQISKMNSYNYYTYGTTPIELCKIEDYQDYIYKENNKWYLHKEIGKLNADTSRTNIVSTYTNIDYATFPKNNDAINYGAWGHYKVYCNKGIYEYITSYDNSENVNKIVSGANQYNYWFGIEKGTTLNEAKELLSNTYVYYILKEPSNNEITDTDLIEQLEAISNSALFDGVNYIDLNSDNLIGSYKITYSTWYEFDKILRNGYNIREDRDRITQKFANGHRKQFVSDYVDCSITLNLDTIDKDTTQDYLQRLKSGAYKYYSIDGKEYRTAQFIIENKPELSVESSISNNVDVNEYQITLLKAGD